MFVKNGKILKKTVKYHNWVSNLLPSADMLLHPIDASAIEAQ